MNFRENLRLAWSCVRANKMRSILTMLGIIIGISAVITISTIGSSLKNTIEKTFNDLTGTNQLGVTFTTFENTDEEFPKIYLEDLMDYKQAFTGMVSAILCSNSEPGLKYQNGDNEANIYLIAETEGYAVSNKYEMVMGRDISIQDNLDRKKVCVVSDLFVKYGMNGEENPIGKPVEITNSKGNVMTVYIIGVYHQTQKSLANMGQSGKAEKDVETDLMIPLSYYWDVNSVPEDNRTFSVFYFLTEPGVDTDTLKTQTVAYFQRHIGKDSDYIPYVQSLEEQLSIISNVLNVITIAISVIAAISLIVGGIGVMNIMLVSVVERTKEIGVRKALGAKNKVIEMQFLVEAVLICLIGGVLGVVLGLVNGGLIAVIIKAVVSNMEQFSFLTVSVTPPIGTIIISVIFSMIVGIVFGLYPARRAARLSPIDALRYE